MLKNLQAELRRSGFSQRNAADRLKISDGHFSDLVHGRGEFTPAQKAELARMVGVNEETLFAQGPAQGRMSTPIAELFKLLDDCLNNSGDPIFILEKIQRLEPEPSYEAACAYLSSTLRRQFELTPQSGPKHWIVSWTQGPQCPQGRFNIEFTDPRRQGEDSFQRLGESVVHPIRRADWTGPARETAMANPTGERR
jgi:transcriptional regulator with XRE-family HTH domain